MDEKTQCLEEAQLQKSDSRVNKDPDARKQQHPEKTTPECGPRKRQELVSNKTQRSETEGGVRRRSCAKCSKTTEKDSCTATDATTFCVTCSEETDNKCVKCRGQLNLNSSETEVVRDSRDQLWHQRCFKCAECKGSLRAKFWVIYVEERAFHEQCLRCSRCAAKLKQSSILTLSNKLYCSSCYDRAAYAKCANCKQPISGGDLVKMRKKKFHAACFKCARCGRLLDEYFEIKESKKPYCESCHHIVLAVALKRRKKQQQRKEKQETVHSEAG